MLPSTYEEGMDALRAITLRCNKEIEDRKVAIDLNALFLVCSLAFLFWLIVDYSKSLLCLSAAGIVLSIVLISWNTWQTRKAKELRTACCAVMLWAEQTYKHRLAENAWFELGRKLGRDE